MNLLSLTNLEKHRTFGVAKIYGCITLVSLLLVQPGNLWLYALVNILSTYVLLLYVVYF